MSSAYRNGFILDRGPRPDQGNPTDDTISPENWAACAAWVAVSQWAAASALGRLALQLHNPHRPLYSLPSEGFSMCLHAALWPLRNRHYGTQKPLTAPGWKGLGLLVGSKDYSKATALLGLSAFLEHPGKALE